MAIFKIGTTRMEVDGGNTEEGEANVDEWGDGRRGKDKKIGVEILLRHPLGQLQPASPAAASCSGREKDNENVEKEAAGEAVARGRLWQQDASVAAPLRGAKQLQEPAAAAGSHEGLAEDDKAAPEAAAGGAAARGRYGKAVPMSVALPRGAQRLWETGTAAAAAKADAVRLWRGSRQRRYGRWRCEQQYCSISLSPSLSLSHRLRKEHEAEPP
jgi:hypothetical protein